MSEDDGYDRNVPGMPGGLMRRPDAPLPLTERQRLSNYVKGEGFLSPTGMKIRELSMQWDAEKTALVDEDNDTIERMRVAAREGGSISAILAGFGLGVGCVVGGMMASPVLGAYAFGALVPAGLCVFLGFERWAPALAERAELKVLERALGDARRSLTAGPVGGTRTPVALPGVRPTTSVDDT